MKKLNGVLLNIRAKATHIAVIFEVISLSQLIKDNSNYICSLAITGTCKLKSVASADDEGWVKFWDNTNSLYREILFDRSLTNIEFLSITGEFLLAYQNSIHLILPDQYLINKNESKNKVTSMKHWIAEDNHLEVIQPILIPYNLLPVFIYSMKTHHPKQHLNRFERHLAGEY